MTLAACLTHQPMHVFSKGWTCANCGASLYFTTAADIAKASVVEDASEAAAWSRMQCEKLTLTIRPETQKALDEIDANIRAAHIAKDTTFLD